MDKSFKRWTAGAAIATIVFAMAIWWAGNDNGISGVCSTLVAQGNYCNGFRTNFWWLVLAIISAVYLGIYVARVRRILQDARQLAQRPPARTTTAAQPWPTPDSASDSDERDVTAGQGKAA